MEITPIIAVYTWTMMLQTVYSLDPVLNHSYCNAYLEDT